MNAVQDRPNGLHFCGHIRCLDRFRTMLFHRERPKVFCIQESEEF